MSYIRKPGHLFESGQPGVKQMCLPDNESYALQQLFAIFRDVMIRQVVDKRHVSHFLLHVSAIRPAWRCMLVFYEVLFLGVMVQIPCKHLGANSEARPIYTLLKKVVDEPLKSHGGSRPFTRHHIFVGLAYTYGRPEVRTQWIRPFPRMPWFNFHFHSLAVALYQTGVLRSPIYFVLAMRDALEISNEYLQDLSLISGSVCLWIEAAGPRLFSQTIDGSLPLKKVRIRQGNLYDAELDKKYGYRRHPLQDVTVHRWRFWLKRIEDEIADVIQYEHLLWPVELDANAGRKAIKILRELMPNEENS
ncbi:hypothetical protein F4818DRAFT_256504 [Hypoxylon cercidicola]|nr:hypothetical protein F4818DRAFT_256504 [Hypoxylon cercidicola]